MGGPRSGRRGRVDTGRARRGMLRVERKSSAAQQESASLAIIFFMSATAPAAAAARGRQNVATRSSSMPETP
jgi:hypothetical protein